MDGHHPDFIKAIRPRGEGSAIAPAPLAAASAASDHPDLGQFARARLDSRANGRDTIAIPIPPRPWPTPAGRLPSSGGVTKARAFFRTFLGRTLLKFVAVLAAIQLAQLVVAAILRWFW